MLSLSRPTPCHAITVVLLVLFGFAAWILLAEISIVADTYRNEYHVSFGGISKAELILYPRPADTFTFCLGKGSLSYTLLSKLSKES